MNDRFKRERERKKLRERFDKDFKKYGDDPKHSLSLMDVAMELHKREVDLDIIPSNKSKKR